MSLKTLRDLRAISPFPSVFERLVLQTRNKGLFGKGLFQRMINLPIFHLVFQSTLSKLKTNTTFYRKNHAKVLNRKVSYL